MGQRVFVSYSSPDQLKADAVRAALEAAGIGCWIAPRDLSAGTQWGAGIVQAVNACEAVVVVFSNAANASPQVAREMELAVSRRLPLIPIRVADDMPTDDMQYFLGVSHWFNAYAQPIEAYLPDIVTAVKRVLARERNPWASLQRRMPRTRAGQVAATVAAAALIAVIVGLTMRPSFPTGPQATALTGRWRTQAPDGKGGKADCTVDIQASGLVAFSDDCPAPIGGATGGLNAAPNGMMAPALFQPGDTGSFQILGGALVDYAAAYRTGLFGGLQTRDTVFGVLKWKRLAADKPMHSEADDVLPAAAPWPLAMTPEVAARAAAYVHAKWRPDAVLMGLELKPGPTGGVGAAFTFYSPGEQQERAFQPDSPGGALTSPYAKQETLSEAIPEHFLDLPEAVDRARQGGMQGKQVSGAKLEWTGGQACGTGDFRIDNAILPRCRPGRFVGVQWTIESALGERFYVPAR